MKKTMNEIRNGAVLYVPAVKAYVEVLSLYPVFGPGKVQACVKYQYLRSGKTATRILYDFALLTHVI